MAKASPSKKTPAEATEPQAPSDFRRLEAALEYLLISQLNAHTLLDSGPMSNKRLVDTFIALLLMLKPDVFLDIGANDGSTAVKVKKMLPACAVAAFEANPQIFNAYRADLAALGVTPMNIAVAAKSGHATIYVPRTLSNAYIGGEIVKSPSVEPANTGKSSLLKRNESATYDEYVVEALSIDDVLRERHPAVQRDVALWIDVEGAAHEVLSGAVKSLERTSIIFIESENHEFWADQKHCAEVARLIISAGFLPLQRDREYNDKQFNTIFIHHSLIHLVYPATYSLEAKAREAARTVEPRPAPPPLLPIATPAKKNSYRSLAACLISEIPVFVPVFNNPTYARNMHRQLKALGIRNIFLVDNASTYDGMLRYLDQAESDATVIRLTENKGPHDLVLSDTNFACMPDLFCVTDPDLQFNKAMPQDFIFDLLNLTNQFQIGKAGLALDLSDRAGMNQEKFLFGGHYYHIWEWEGQFWQHQATQFADGTPVYKANIDTTFALYNKKFFKKERFYDALRVAGAYTCRHLPWYPETGLPVEEDTVYRATQKFSYHMR